MHSQVRRLLEIVDQVLEVTAHPHNTEYHKALQQAAEDLRENPDVVVQLFGVSQAGKSTLISALLDGEQYVPVGRGKATTAVVIHVVPQEGREAPEATVQWLSPVEVIKLLREPLDLFVPDDFPWDKLIAPDGPVRGKKGHPAIRLPQIFGGGQPAQPRAPSRLSEKEWGVLVDALQAARDLREMENAGPGRSEMLDVAEVILRHYDAYLASRWNGLQPVPLDELQVWTRQPPEWGTAPIGSFEFPDLRSFFVSRVELFVPATPLVDGLRFVDAPGFGVSTLHDSIVRRVQDSADAVLLVLGASGSTITHQQLEAVQQLVLRGADNLFVVWNPKSGYESDAEELLTDDLQKLAREARVRLPRSRAAVAHLKLALRARQWLRAGELSGVTVSSLAQATRRPASGGNGGPRAAALRMLETELRTAWLNFLGNTDQDVDPHADAAGTLAEHGLAHSGWERVQALLGEIRTARPNRRILRCAAAAGDAIAFYLAEFATPADAQRLEAMQKVISRLVGEFPGKSSQIEEKVTRLVDSYATHLLEELVASLIEADARRNLMSGVETVINDGTHLSDVQLKLRARVKDYLRARCAHWCERAAESKTTYTKAILTGYTGFTAELLPAVGELQESGVALELNVPRAPTPEIDFREFRKAFDATFGEAVDGLLSPGLFQSLLEVVAKAKTFVKDKWNGLVAWWKQQPKVTTPPAPSYNKLKTRERIKAELERFLAAEQLLPRLVLDPRGFRDPTLPELLSAVLGEALQGKLSLDQALAGAERRLEHQWTEYANTPNGPWRSLVGAVRSGALQTFSRWRTDVLGALNMLGDNVRAAGGHAGLVPAETLARLDRQVAALVETVSGDVEASSRLAQARARVNAHLGVEEGEPAMGLTG